MKMRREITLIKNTRSPILFLKVILNKEYQLTNIQTRTLLGYQCFDNAVGSCA
jgi:hypothetical protein